MSPPFTVGANPTTSNVVIQNVRVSPSAINPNTHGIYVYKAANVVVDRCTVDNAWGNGINVDSSSRVAVLASTVSQTQVLHGIALVNSDNNQVVGNTVRSVAFHGVLLLGSSNNYIAQNDIQQHKYDGITVSVWCQGGASACEPDTAGNRRSLGNVLVGNTVANQRASNAGTGIWLNLGADGTCVLANDESGQVEAGITSFDAGRNLLFGNRVSANAQAGVLLWDVTDSSLHPQYNFLRRNYLFNNPANGQVFSRGSIDGDIAFNFMDDSDDSRAHDAGVRLDPSPEGVATQRFRVFANSFRNLQSPHGVASSTRDVTVFRDRMFNSPDNFSFLGATVKWDGQLQIGGNYYSDFAANGNPSPRRHALQGLHRGHARQPGRGLRGPLPLQGREPGPALLGQRAPAGRRDHGRRGQPAGGRVAVRRLRARRHLVRVRGRPGRPSSRTTPTRASTTGRSPRALSPGSYTVEVELPQLDRCRHRRQRRERRVHRAKPDLVLLTPDWSQVVTGNDAGRRHRRCASRGGRRPPWERWTFTVSVDGGAFNARGLGYLRRELRGRRRPEYQLEPRRSTGCRPRGDASVADTSDGYVQVRNSTRGAFRGISAGEDWLMGEVEDLEWTLPGGATFVDLEMYDTTVQLVRDAGQGMARVLFAVLAPGGRALGVNHALRATFRNASGAAIGSPTVSNPLQHPLHGRTRARRRRSTASTTAT